MVPITKVDATLVASCLAGDQKAWVSLVSRYENLVYSVIRLHFRASRAADDVFQDVWLEVYKNLHSVRDLQALPAWIITVTRRNCSKALSQTDWSFIEAETLPEVDERLPAIENRFWLEKAMQDLSDRDRVLIHALYLDPDQPSYQEISTKLDIAVASIGPTRSRCLEKIRRKWVGESG